MRYLKRYEDLDFSGYIPEETRYKEVQSIAKDILIDLDEFSSIEWSIEELKSKYFPNVFVANCYDCVANLTITSVDMDPLPSRKEDSEWKVIIERLIEVLNMEGFIIFEHSSKNITSAQDIITDNWLRDSFGSYYKNFKICLTKSLRVIDNYRKE